MVGTRNDNCERFSLNLHAYSAGIYYVDNVGNRIGEVAGLSAFMEKRP